MRVTSKTAIGITALSAAALLLDACSIGTTSRHGVSSVPMHTVANSVEASPPVTPGSRGESHPPAPTDPDVSLSTHPALVVLITRPSGTRTSGRTEPGTRW